MRHARTLVLGGFLVGTIAIAGCGSSTSPVDSASGTGGATSDASTDHTAIDSGTGTGGAAGADAGVDVHADTVTDTVSDVNADSPADVADSGTVADARDAAAEVSGPCVTSFGAGNPVQYAFNGGANGGWYQYVTDLANSGLTTSLGASFTEGHSCPGALVLGVNFTAYGSPNVHVESGFAEIYYAASPGGRDWSAYKALHAWIKVQTPDPLGLDGVYFYVKSANQTRYQSDFAVTADLGDWHEVVVDLTHVGSPPANVVTNDVQLIGFEVALKSAPPAGAPATPSQAILFADDIWLEALPPSPDGGAGDGGDAHAADAGGQ